MIDPTGSMKYWYDSDIDVGYDKYTEKFIISSGSVDGTRKFLGNGRNQSLFINTNGSYIYWFLF